MEKKLFHDTNFAIRLEQILDKLTEKKSSMITTNRIVITYNGIYTDEILGKKYDEFHIYREMEE